jgi:hypothetical protein
MISELHQKTTNRPLKDTQQKQQQQQQQQLAKPRQAMNIYIPATNECPTAIKNDDRPTKIKNDDGPTKIKSVTFQRVEVLEFEKISRTKSFPAASPGSLQQRKTSYDIDTFERSVRRTKSQELDGYSTIVDYLQQIPKCPPDRISRRKPVLRRESGRSCSTKNPPSRILPEDQKEQRRKLSPAMPQRQRSLQTEKLEVEFPRLPRRQSSLLDDDDDIQQIQISLITNTASSSN